jgi:hypothetical protein
MKRGQHYINGHCLFRNDKYCCFGVLCSINKIIISDGESEGYVWLEAEAINLTPFVEMNDVLNKTFPEIADWIEENL